MMRGDSSSSSVAGREECWKREEHFARASDRLKALNLGIKLNQIIKSILSRMIELQGPKVCG